MSITSGTLIFLHIPKAGGTTFISILRRQYGRDHIYTIDNEAAKMSTERYKRLSTDEKRKYRVTLDRSRFLDPLLFVSWKFEFYTEKYGWRELRNFSMKAHLKKLAIASGKDVFETEIEVATCQGAASRCG